MRDGDDELIETGLSLDAKILRKLGCVVYLLGSPTNHATGRLNSISFMLFTSAHIVCYLLSAS